MFRTVPYGGQQSGQDMGGFVMHVNPAMQNQPPPNFQLSNCKWMMKAMSLKIQHLICDFSLGQGRKRALLIGINYFGSPNELKGCINDVHNVKDFLITLYNFRQASILYLFVDIILFFNHHFCYTGGYGYLDGRPKRSSIPSNTAKYDCWHAMACT